MLCCAEVDAEDGVLFVVEVECTELEGGSSAEAAAAEAEERPAACDRREWV